MNRKDCLKTHSIHSIRNCVVGFLLHEHVVCVAESINFVVLKFKSINFDPENRERHIVIVVGFICATPLPFSFTISPCAAHWYTGTQLSFGPSPCACVYASACWLVDALFGFSIFSRLDLVGDETVNWDTGALDSIYRFSITFIIYDFRQRSTLILFHFYWIFVTPFYWNTSYMRLSSAELF